MKNSTSIVLDKSTCIIVSPDEPFGVRRAASAVARDLEAALGAPIRCLPERPADGGTTIVVESNMKLAAASVVAAKMNNDEQFVIRTASHDGNPAVIINGGGERGAIYGLFHFAHEYLGADPLQHFTGKCPPKRDAIELPAIDHVSKPFAYRFRGWHIENTQTLKQWKDAGGHERYWPYFEQMLETLLRLGGNMVKPNTNEPDSQEVALSQRMGLLITQEHCCPLGVGMWNIHSDEPGFNFHFDEFSHVYTRHWEEAIDKYPDPRKVIWTLSFRGRGDRPFWMEDPAYDTDPKRGELITRVLNIQRDLVRRRVPDAQFIHNTWMEGNRLVTQGHTRPPEGTHVVYADNGYGTFRSMIAEGCDPEQVAPILPQKKAGGVGGVYFHVSMWDFNTPFLTNFIPPQRIEEQFRQVEERELTGYLLINVGRVRDCVSSFAAIADVWTHGSFSADAFSRKWNSRFGDAAADARKCYDALYHTPFKWGAWGGWDDYMVADVGYIRRGALFIEQALNPARRRVLEAAKMKFWEGAPKTLAQQLTYMREQTASALPRWDEAQRLARSVAAQLKDPALALFEVDALTGIDIHRALNAYLQHVIDGVTDYEKGELPSALAQIRHANERLDDLQTAMRLRERGSWSGWNTPALIQFACLPMARRWNDLFIEVIETMTTRRPTAW